MRVRTLGCLAYPLAFLALTAPLALHPLDRVLGDWGQDLEHCLWVPWWLGKALGSPDLSLFESRFVAFPHDVDLQLADINLAVSVPVWLAGRVLPPAAAQNLALLASFLLAATLQRRLALRLGADPGPAWLAGLLFAGSPYWLSCALNGWGYLVHVWTLPLIFLAALRVRDAPGALSGAGLGLALALAFHVTPYYFLYAGLLLAGFVAWQLATGAAGARPPALRQLPVAAFATGAALLLTVAPRALGMAEAAASQDLVVHHGPLNTRLAAPLVELVWPAGSAVAARESQLGYLVVFLGYTLLGGIGLSLWRSPLRVEQGVWLGLAAGSLLFALGPWLVLADGVPTGIPLPAALLQRIPVFDLTTNHWRWILPVGFSLTLLLALSLTGALAGRQDRLARAAIPLLVLAWALEVLFVWPIPYPQSLTGVAPSPVAALLRDRSDVHVVLDRTDRRKLDQTVHEKPIVLGWLPRIDRETHRAGRDLVRRCSGEGFPCLRRAGIDAVVRDPHTAILLDARGEVREVLRAPAPTP